MLRGDLDNALEPAYIARGLVMTAMSPASTECKAECRPSDRCRDHVCRDAVPPFSGYPATLPLLTIALPVALLAPVWFVPIAATALWAGMLGAISDLARSAGAADQWIPAAICGTLLALLTYLTPRFLHLLATFWRHFGLRGTDRPTQTMTPLPSQKDVIENLLDICRNPSSYQHPYVINIEADWGHGKTTILETLQRRLTGGSSPIATVYFNAWEHQRDPLPETALFRTIARNWEVLIPFGWLAIPALLLKGTLLPKTLKLAFKGKVEAETSIDLAPPPDVFWQHSLQRLARIVRFRNRTGIVILLDEVDRCDPIAAQRFLTLVRRALAWPGVIVILPTVKHQLFVKAFNPLMPQLPDLRGTFQAIMWNGMGRHVTADLLDRTLEKSAAPEAAGDGKIDPDDRKPGFPHYAGAMARLTAYQYLEMHPTDRERVCRMMADKYLADHVVSLPALKAEDFLSLVKQSPHAPPRWQQDFGMGSADPAHLDEILTNIWKKHVTQENLSLRDTVGLIHTSATAYERLSEKLGTNHQKLLALAAILIAGIRLRGHWQRLPDHAFPHDWMDQIPSRRTS